MKNVFARLMLTAAVVSCLISAEKAACAGDAIITSAAISSHAMAATPAEGDDNETGCPAAAVLGSSDAQLDTLRLFRDNVLATSPVGQKLIEIYYAQGGKIVSVLEKNPALKSSAKKVLIGIMPAVKMLVNGK